jgi:Stigma-specific protein, Stig1
MAREDGLFDDLARGLADGTLTRGKALRLMDAALVGGALAFLPGVALADDDCRSFGRRCRRDSQCCSRNCVRRGDEKVCGCPEGKRRCGDRCVDLKTNERHCGSCSNRCAEGEECVDGVCQGGCPSGTTPCGGNCLPSCQQGQALDPTSCQCLAICTNTTGHPCNTCKGEGGNTEICLCQPTSDGTTSVCHGPFVTCVSSCDKCGVFNGMNLPVCLPSGVVGPGCEFYCTSTCLKADGVTCGNL